MRDPFPGELRIVLARGEGGKGKKWETHSSGIFQYCSASIRPLQTSTKLTFNQTTKIQLRSTSKPGGDIWHRGEACGPFKAAVSTLDSLRPGAGWARGSLVAERSWIPMLPMIPFLCVMSSDSYVLRNVQGKIVGRKSSRTLVSNWFWNALEI